jgi:hypothetical protein
LKKVCLLLRLLLLKDYEQGINRSISDTFEKLVTRDRRSSFKLGQEISSGFGGLALVVLGAAVF